MGTTAASWTVEGDITTSTGNLVASAGNVTARDYLSVGVVGGYLTDGKYNWMISDGDGIKQHVATLWDIGTDAWARVYVVSGEVKAEAA